MTKKYFLDTPDECLKLSSYGDFFDNFLRFMGYTPTNNIENTDKIFLVMCAWASAVDRATKLLEIDMKKKPDASVEVVFKCAHCKKTRQQMRNPDFETIRKQLLQIFPNRLLKIKQKENPYKIR